MTRQSLAGCQRGVLCRRREARFGRCGQLANVGHLLRYSQNTSDDDRLSSG